MDTLQSDHLITLVEQEIEIAAPPATVFDGLIENLTTRHTGPGDEPLPMVLEQRPGGRWFRDFGNDTGHLWAFVQSIKPPVLLEFYGPLFMSFGVANNVIFRLEESAGGTTLKFRHQVLGQLPEDYREGIGRGWAHLLSVVKTYTER